MEIPSIASVFDTSEQLALAAAERFVEYAHEAQASQGRFSVALAGGQTPRRVYELLATEQFKNRLDWSRVFLFFGDERCVPPIDPESNYAMVAETLISKVPVPPANVFRMAGEGTPTENAQAYENHLREFFPGSPWPQFDLVMLGMGADGHTASLFPRSDALDESSRWVVTTKNPQGQNRITLTLPALSHAGHILFLVTGKEKAATLLEILRAQSQSTRLPASLIAPVDGTLEWFADRDAASLL